MKKLFSNVLTFLKLSYEEWSEDRASRLAAALSYYMTFSIAPLLIIVISITGLIWQKDVVQAQLLSQIQGLVGPQGANFIASLLNSTGSQAQNIFAMILGIITLLFGALGVFDQIHTSLNIIWDVKEEKTKGFLQTVKKTLINRLLSFTMILGIGFLLLVSLVISTALSGLQETISNLFPFSQLIVQTINLVISLGVITVLFALMFKILPDVEIAWRDVWLGAFGTAILFSIGKTALGIYLGNSNVASAYGAAGSLVLLLLWIYYSAQILFFGAEFTQVYANKYGPKILAEGEERVVQAKIKETRDFREQPFLPARVAMPVTSVESQLEKENRQTARVFAGFMLASFVTGILTAVFGFGKRR